MESNVIASALEDDRGQRTWVVWDQLYLKRYTASRYSQKQAIRAFMDALPPRYVRHESHVAPQSPDEVRCLIGVSRLNNRRAG